MALGLPHFCPTVSLVPRAVIRRSELIFRHRLVQRIRDQTQPLNLNRWPPFSLSLVIRTCGLYGFSYQLLAGLDYPFQCLFHPSLQPAFKLHVTT
ncbi:hypothetical protein SAMN05216185_103487 [Pseudomonas guariconensis]|nr:hypothetical protein SAMN05216185_103487 [Pseudomonas guariconensis]